MSHDKTPKTVKMISIQKSPVYGAADLAGAIDMVSVEEPLEIRVGLAGESSTKQIAVTMRTPADDRELAAGFLFTEAILSSPDQIERIDIDELNNAVYVWLHVGVEIDEKQFARHSFVASSCGVCGKKSIDAVRINRQYDCSADQPLVSADVIKGLAKTLSPHQSDFHRTGGLHASSLFDASGRFLALKEDVGRHNALDKLIGHQFLQNLIPMQDQILMVSGRASFELVQKAAHAGLGIMVAVGAPSSLAVELAEESNMTLIGFARDDRFNVYSGAHRIVLN